MPKADSENTTAMPAVSTRRRFLLQAAGIAAGGTVLASLPILSVRYGVGEFARPDSIIQLRL